MKIFLIRHGESAGNMNSDLYEEYGGDRHVPITMLGSEQIRSAGLVFRAYIDSNPELQGKTIHLINSPYERTRQSRDIFVKTVGLELFHPHVEHESLREQSLGVGRPFRDHKYIGDPMSNPHYYKYLQYETQRRDGNKFNAKPPEGGKPGGNGGACERVL